MSDKTQGGKTLMFVDDHAMILKGLEAWFSENSDWIVLDSASSGTEALRRLSEHEVQGNLPTVLVVDINLGTENGFDLLATVVEKWPLVFCLMYSFTDSATTVQKALDMGARGYVSKAASEQELLAAVETVAAGGRYIEHKLVSALIVCQNILAALTKREKQVVQLILDNKTNLQIAEELELEKRAVENYISRIYSKLRLKNRTELLELFGSMQ